MRPIVEACLTCGMPRSPFSRPRRVSPSLAPPPFHWPTRRGFTLVEVVVAVVLLAIASLGVASTTMFVARLAATARALALAARATADIVDSLRGTPCASLGAGSAGTPAGNVQWTASAAGSTRHVRAVLTPLSTRVRAPLVEEVIVPCD